MLAPILGILADRSARRRWFVLSWTVLGVLATGALYGVSRGQWGMAAGLFVLATMGFNGAIVFYDALLLQVAEPEDYDRVSAYGYALGYLGGGLLFAVNVVMMLHPAWFGLSDSAAAVRFSFLTVALWWLVFSIPLALGVREPKTTVAAQAQVSAWGELARTLREMATHRPLWMFLLAYWLYIDGVNTIIKMAVDYGGALGLPTAGLMAALLLTQFVAFPAALLYGWIGNRVGAAPGDPGRPAGLHRRDPLGHASRQYPGFFRHGGHHRAGSGRRAEPVAIAVRAVRAARQVGRVFWLLQHARQVCDRAWSGADRRHREADAQFAQRYRLGGAAVPGRRGAVVVRARAGSRRACAGHLSGA